MKSTFLEAKAPGLVAELESKDSRRVRASMPVVGYYSDEGNDGKTRLTIAVAAHGGAVVRVTSLTAWRFLRTYWMEGTSAPLDEPLEASGPFDVVDRVMSHLDRTMDSVFGTSRRSRSKRG